MMENRGFKQVVAGATVCASVWLPGSKPYFISGTKINKEKYTPFSINEALSNSRTYNSSYLDSNLLKIRENKNHSFIEQAKSLFGEQRYFTESERKLYKKVTEAQSKDLGINVFDLMRERNASRVG